jgi:hypothetical protein
MGAIASESCNKGPLENVNVLNVDKIIPDLGPDLDHVRLRMNHIFFTYNTSKIQVSKDEFVSVQLLEYSVTVNRFHEAKVLLDTGANASFVDYKFVKRIGLNRLIQPDGSNASVSLAGKGSVTRCYGSILLPVTIGGITFKLFFYMK